MLTVNAIKKVLAQATQDPPPDPIFGWLAYKEIVWAINAAEHKKQAPAFEQDLQQKETT